MDLKNNKGFVGIDISIAVIVLLILVPTIMGIVFNINSTQNVADIKTEAMNIAINALEAAKGLGLQGLNSAEEGKEEKSIIDEMKLMYSFSEANDNSMVITTSKASYRLVVTVKDYSEDHEGADRGIIKTVTASVTYKAKGEEKTLDLSTVIK